MRNIEILKVELKETSKIENSDLRVCKYSTYGLAKRLILKRKIRRCDYANKMEDHCIDICAMISKRENIQYTCLNLKEIRENLIELLELFGYDYSLWYLDKLHEIGNEKFNPLKQISELLDTVIHTVESLVVWDDPLGVILRFQLFYRYTHENIIEAKEIIDNFEKSIYNMDSIRSIDLYVNLLYEVAISRRDIKLLGMIDAWYGYIFVLLCEINCSNRKRDKIDVGKVREYTKKQEWVYRNIVKKLNIEVFEIAPKYT